MTKFFFKVRGVTFENRQEIIKNLKGVEPVKIIPEPENKFDKNAHGVNVPYDGAVRHIGYVPGELVAKVSEFFDGEEFDGKITEITGGFEKLNGERATYGVTVMFEIPDDLAGDLSAGWEV